MREIKSLFFYPCSDRVRVAFADGEVVTHRRGWVEKHHPEALEPKALEPEAQEPKVAVKDLEVSISEPMEEPRKTRRS